MVISVLDTSFYSTNIKHRHPFFLKNLENWYIYLKNNNSHITLKEIKIGFFNTCDSNRYSLGYARLKLDDLVKANSESVVKFSYPINGLVTDYQKIKCIDIEDVYHGGGNDSAQAQNLLKQQNTQIQAVNPNRFAAVYFDKNSTGFGWIIGASSLEEAKSEALKSCISRSPPGADCDFSAGGNHRCIAVAEGIQWRYSYVGNSHSEVKKAVMDACNKNDTCSIPDQGIACEKW
jgi:hypothetical protein